MDAKDIQELLTVSREDLVAMVCERDRRAVVAERDAAVARRAYSQIQEDYDIRGRRIIRLEVEIKSVENELMREKEKLSKRCDQLHLVIDTLCKFDTLSDEVAKSLREALSL